MSASEAKDRADLDREHAEKNQEQMWAGKILERVQMQLAEFVYPATTSILAALYAWVYLSYAVGADGYIGQYQAELIT